ncbi:hypothetical protein CHELA1G11_11983 [Hyphomicrobiales bacterium]|nr:hypothetical protein CHELA1G11_11983 [Hyphomicrobiales bacterium]CAH1664101.1 hypothetical protein CHELA1G2_12328 [Hyphomicrobiales bacterium]
MLLASVRSPVLDPVSLVTCWSSPIQMAGVDAAPVALAARVSTFVFWRWLGAMRHLTHQVRSSCERAVVGTMGSAVTVSADGKWPS